MTWFRRVSRAALGALAGGIAGALAVLPATAQLLGSPAASDAPDDSIASVLPHQGDPWGKRKKLADHGIKFYLISTDDLLSNVAGGQRRGTIYQGKLEAQVAVDLDKLAGWKDFTLYANAFQIRNTGRMRRDYVGGMNTIAAIEANSTTRLSELWLERSFMNGAASFRFGQLAADSEFFFSDLSAMFLQSDWPTITAVNTPGGGAAYPLSTPGVRLKVDPNKNVSLLIAFLNGDPAGPCAGDPDTCNRYGLNFRVRDPGFVIGEAQFRWNQDKSDKGLATVLKIGGWQHLAQFADFRYAADGSRLADPNGSGVARRYRGDYGIYGVIDQQLYRPAGGAADSGISFFTRASISPSDRNLVDLETDVGLIFAGLWPQRENDRFGASLSYTRFGKNVQGFDRDRLSLGIGPGFVRDYEANLELTYVAQVMPGWTLQPDFQYIWHPSGQKGRDARVVGLRSVIKY